MDTETTTLSNRTGPEIKVNNLLALKTITLKDIEGLTRIEREHLEEVATLTLDKLKGDARDKFLDKIDQIIPASMKSKVWEYNHMLISDAINRLMRRYGIMPPKTAIADETGLSRQTINKHLKEYKAQPEFLAQMEDFKFMAPKILANVFKSAGDGDVRAARLYFEVTGVINKAQNTVVNGQTNYIQINNTILSQENLKQLTAEELNQIESIVAKKRLNEGNGFGV